MGRNLVKLYNRITLYTIFFFYLFLFIENDNDLFLFHCEIDLISN